MVGHYSIRLGSNIYLFVIIDEGVGTQNNCIYCEGNESYGATCVRSQAF